MNEQEQQAQHIAEMLLTIGAVSLSPDVPFTWSSGLKSPIYCDNRLTMGFPEVRNQIADYFVQRIREEYPETEVIAGISTGGIPHGAWIAERMNLPFVYIRGEAKGHGKKSQIEGVLQAGQKMFIVEDLFSTGGSSVIAANAARAEGADVLEVAAIFSYEFALIKENFAKHRVSHFALSGYTALLQEAFTRGRITQTQLETLSAWREDPQAFSDAHS